MSMERECVDSSMIRSIGYDSYLCILEVEFNNDAVWRYNDFPEYLWHEFLASDSTGKFFHENIRGPYTQKGCRVQ